MDSIAVLSQAARLRRGVDEAEAELDTDDVGVGGGAALPTARRRGAARRGVGGRRPSAVEGRGGAGSEGDDSTSLDAFIVQDSGSGGDGEGEGRRRGRARGAARKAARPPRAPAAAAAATAAAAAAADEAPPARKRARLSSAAAATETGTAARAVTAPSPQCLRRAPARVGPPASDGDGEEAPASARRRRAVEESEENVWDSDA